MTDRLDDAIDRAVREMLDVEPQADLRARVMAQLPVDGSRRPAFGVRLPASGWVLGSFAAAVIVVLAMFVARRSEPLAPPQAPVVARAVDQRLPAPGAAAAITPPSVVEMPAHRIASHSSPAVPAALRPARPDAVVATAFASDDSPATPIDPLKTIAPITVAPITQERLAAADITPRPLTTITEIQITPLTPADRRN
jgi:hypothetical protein